jgi:hypothetical protein
MPQILLTTDCGLHVAFLIDLAVNSVFLFLILSDSSSFACLCIAYFQSTKAENKRLQTEIQSLKHSMNDPSKADAGKGASSSYASSSYASSKEQELLKRKVQDLGMCSPLDVRLTAYFDIYPSVRVSPSKFSSSDLFSR